MAVKHGIVLKKIHRVLSFKQKPFLKPYIEKNTELRIAATNDFQKVFYKLMNNIIFGRSFLNKRKYISFKLVGSWKSAERYIAKNRYHRTIIFSKNLVGIHIKQEKITLDTLPYLASAILDLSKKQMQEYHYEFILPNLRANLIYTDTDSLIYEIFSNIYDFINSNIQMFDTSGYPEGNIHGIPRVNAKIPLKLKDETNGIPIREIICLRS